MRAAVSAAKDVQRAADQSANAMADLIRGRLRFVSERHLAELKRELRGFNIQTKRWTEAP